jgi:hypothetical protein
MTAAARPDPLAFLDSLDRYGPVPPPRDLAGLDCWLRGNGYTDVATRAIVAHAARWGTVECCGWLDDEADRAICEELLPDAGPAAWVAGDVTWFATPTMASPDESYP